MDTRAGAAVTFDAEFLVRVCAALAAVALVASPVVVAAYKAAQGWLSRTRPQSEDVTLSDMRLVLEIANRLRLRGNEDGVDLCEKLLNVMLASSPEK